MTLDRVRQLAGKLEPLTPTERGELKALRACNSNLADAVAFVLGEQTTAPSEKFDAGVQRARDRQGPKQHSMFKEEDR